MASKRGQKRKQCGRKQAFDTVEGAIKKANYMRSRHPGEKIDAYKCGQCGKFHIGHRTTTVNMAMKARKK